ncbi:MAG: YfhO family protein [Candidatus Cloacimonetes bacterium]|nr:YfhO family protein [Candidatus Cloacimonadota bacterium]
MKKNKNLDILNQPEKDIFNTRWSHILMISLIIITISTLFYKIAFLDYIPKAHDTSQWRNSAQQIISYNENHSDQALWTDNMFSGMPAYLISLPAKYPFLNTLLHSVDSVINWRILYLIFGAIGMYLLMIHLKFHPLIALFAGLSFALTTHSIGIIEIGHNTKFKAFMYYPWIFLMLDDLRKNKRLLSLGFLSFFLIDQLRINHIQISYYMFMIIFIYWIAFLIKSIKNKNVKDFSIFSILLLTAFIITLFAVLNPYLSVWEYSHYTIRGESGLTPEYATGWSFGIPEVLNFLVPNFFGGISPYYWGNMIFTQTFVYMGILVLFLAVFAGIFYFKKTIIKVLVASSIVALFISFGKNLPFLSSLLLNYLPGFNKFRVPAMTLVVVQFCIVVLASYGIKLFLEMKKENSKRFQKLTFITLLSSIGLTLLFLVGNKIFAMLPFSRPDEIQRYQPEQIEYLMDFRLNLLLQSGIKSFGILSMGILTLFLFLKSKIKRNVALVILIALTVLDLTIVNNNYLKDEILVKESTIMQDFQNQAVDDFLLQDDSLYRIYPYHDFSNARWAYHHQTIGGYHGAKIGRYQDLIDKCFNAEFISGIPLNFNIINMLNVKYLIFNKFNLPIQGFQLVYQDRITQNNVYENLNVLPRAWFVKQHEIITDKNKIFLRLNNPDFNPATNVIVEQQIPDFKYNQTDTIELTYKDIHKTVWKTKNDSTSFMVISEIFYPKGWNVYINGKKSNFIQSNYILRGLLLEPGENIVEMIFEPSSYKISTILSLIGLSLSLILSIAGLFVYYKLNYRGKIIYKLKK